VLQKITDQPVAVHRHRDQIALFAFGGSDNLRGRVAEGEVGGYFQTRGAQLGSGLHKIVPVVLHLLRLREFELLEIPRHPAVGHVHEQQLRVEPFGQLGDVRQEAFVRAAVFQSNENLAIHGGFQEQTLSPATPATYRTGI